jgi:hypothetical protein
LQPVSASGISVTSASFDPGGTAFSIAITADGPDYSDASISNVGYNGQFHDELRDKVADALTDQGFTVEKEVPLQLISGATPSARLDLLAGGGPEHTYPT